MVAPGPTTSAPLVFVELSEARVRAVSRLRCGGGPPFFTKVTSWANQVLEISIRDHSHRRDTQT